MGRCRWVETVTCPPAGVCANALSTRAVSARRSAAREPSTIRVLCVTACRVTPASAASTLMLVTVSATSSPGSSSSPVPGSAASWALISISSTISPRARESASS